MRAVFITALAGLTLTACAVQDTPAQRQNQPHLPPPDFSAVEAVSKPRYCGVRSADSNICETDEFCRRTIGDLCGAADAPGVCSPKPEICTQQYDPVCGCDGKTYSNECTANAVGISAAAQGECAL